MSNDIVTVNVSTQAAPPPSTLQRTGAIISQGATTLAPQARAILTQAGDLTSLLSPAKALTSLTWSGSVVTGTTSAPHGWTNGDTVAITVAGATPAGYNGTFQGTVTGASSFTYPLVSNPGSETIPGTVTLGDVAELTAQVGTFFAQGSGLSVYVLELGETTPVAGIAALATWLTANPNVFYSYLVPREWDAVSQFLTLLAGFESTTSRTYFYITTTIGTYTSYTALMKCAFTLIEAAGIPSTEFSCAAAFYRCLNYNPNIVNKVAPTAFAFVFGVTPYSTVGNAAQRLTLKTAGVNIIGTGAAGQISNAILLWGTTMDKRDFTYWYSVDWMQININIALTNAIINGSNDPINPLYYSQDGINRLQARAQQTANAGVSFGLALPPVTVNAVGFIAYTTANPGDYPLGIYNGLSMTYTPSRGFTGIAFNIVVTDFVAQ